MEKEKISFFKKVLISLKDFEKYILFVQENVGKSFKYIIQLLLILIIFITLSFLIKYGMIANEVIQYVKGDLPDFTYEDGKLGFKISEPLILEKEKNRKDIYSKVIIDTSEISDEKINEYKNQVSLYNYGVIILKNKIIINSSLVSREIEQTYSDLQVNYGIPNSFTKQDVINYLSNNRIYKAYAEIFAILYIYLFITYFTALLLDAVLLTIIGVITARIVKIKIGYKEMYSIGLHALTLPVILNTIYIIVNTHTGFYIKYFDLMYSTISYIYVFAAILSMKTIIAQKQTIIESEEKEEKQNEEEMKEEEKETDDKNKDKDVEKDNKKKEKKDDEPDNNLGEPVESE